MRAAAHTEGDSLSYSALHVTVLWFGCERRLTLRASHLAARTSPPRASHSPRHPAPRNAAQEASAVEEVEEVESVLPEAEADGELGSASASTGAESTRRFM